MNRYVPQSFQQAVRCVAADRSTRYLAVATIDAVTSPAPLPVGEQMLVWADGLVGTVSAGCIDSDVATVARHVLTDGESRTRHYGPHGELLGAGELFAATTCGGTITVGIDRLEVSDGEEAAVAAIVGRSGKARRTRRLVIVGATTTAAELARLAGPLGYWVTVIDPRPAFATTTQVPDAHELRCGWPGRILATMALGPNDAVVLLTNDDRYATDVLAAALSEATGYVGALGSFGTAQRHRQSLRAAGIASGRIGELHSPVGLPIGATGPVQIAVSIAAQLITHSSEA